MARRERMAPVDITWLRMDRPTNLMVIVAVLTLAGPVDPDHLERTLAARLLVFPRFRQCAETGLTGAWWNDDPYFNIGRHIKHARLPGAGGKAELQRFVADLASHPLDGAHPLWQFHIVEDYEDGAAVVVRIHHAIADGIALIGVLLSLTDEHPDAPSTPMGAAALPAENGAAGAVWDTVFAPMNYAVAEGVRVTGALWRGYLDMLANPAKAVEYARLGPGIAAELAGLTFMPDDSRTRFKGRLSGDKRVAWSEPVALPEIQAASHALGCSVNDMLLAAVAGALNGYLRDKGDPTAGVEVRALVPVNLRPPGSGLEFGNRFGVVAVSLPVGFDNPLVRLYEVHRRMEVLKHSYEPLVTLGLLAALGYAPKVVQDQVFELLLSRATAVMTNVPGPQRPLYVDGARLKEVMAWVPQAGDIGMGVSLLSFDGKVQFGLITDAALVPDPEAIIARFAPEFEKLLYVVLLQPDHTGPSAPAAS